MRIGILLVMGLVWVGRSWAAADDGLQLEEGSRYADCLTSVAKQSGGPEYPPDQFKLRNSALLNVELSFQGKDVPPSVRYLDKASEVNENYLEFYRAVEKHVQDYRLACWEQGTVRLNQQFKFVPDARKSFVLPPEDPFEAQQTPKGCKFEAPAGKPAYPSGAMGLGAGPSGGGNVVLRMVFHGVDAEPEVQVVYDGRSRPLAGSAQAWARGYRMRCATPPTNKISATQLFRYQLEGATRYALKDLNLVQFLQSVDRTRWAGARFDFSTMSCPFEVRVTLMQPFADNRVAELESNDPARKPFLMWLRKQKFQIPSDAERFLIGEPLNVTVPCMNLDLS